MKIFKHKMLGNNKGITLIMMALMLALLLALAALAIDIAYMYVVKNELQVAADAAALAGAARLTDAIDGGGTPPPEGLARQEAWKFACRNTAAKQNVYLVTNNAANCNNPPLAANLNSSNNAAGDIVIGNWNPTTRVFTPATGSTGLIINSLKARPRRTGETPGMPRVSLFLGGVLRALWEGAADWRFMSARAEAIAARPPRAGQYFSICNDPSFCESCTYPTTCVLPSPRVLDTKTSSPSSNRFAWTSLLSSPPSSNEFITLICQNLPFQEVCGQSIQNFTGGSSATFKALESAMYNPNYDASNKTIVAGTVTNWTVIVPVTSVCPPDGASAMTVWGYARLRLTRVCGSGGGNACSPVSYNAPPGTCGNENIIVIDSISCISCAQNEGGLKPVLVR
jgi:Flp pilus assembly protein TadG